MDLKANHPPTDVINPPPTNSGLRPWLAPMTTYGAYSDNPSSKLFLRKPLDDMWALWDIHLYISKLHLPKSYLFTNGRPVFLAMDVPLFSYSCSPDSTHAANGDTIEELLEEYPSLEREDILACLDYVASLAEEQVTPIEALASAI